MSEDKVTLAIEEGVATIVLNRPDVGNAIDLALAHRWREIVEQCVRDDAVRCVVVTGAGRMFCVGGDVAAMAAAGDRRPEFLHEMVGSLNEVMIPLLRMDKPLLTLVNGPAAGAGFSIAIAGDVVLAASSASFLAAYGGVGLTADGGMSWLLPRLVGLRQAQRLIFLNEPVAADEAASIGLVTRIVDDDALQGEGRKLAQKLASCSMPAVGGSRALLRASFETGFEEQLDKERRSMTEAARTPENAEGLAAFLERRKPDFRSAN